MDLDLIQSRLDYFHNLGYLTYHSDKEHHLFNTTLLLVLKVFSMMHGLSFPTVNARNIKEVEAPVVYVTDMGEKIFLKHISVMSKDLFDMVAPVFKGTLEPSTFELSNPRTLQNLRGLVGSSTRKTVKPPLKVHLLVDNSPPFDYLQPEYIFDTMYEARMFTNKLIAYLPTARLELWRVRTDMKTGVIRRDLAPLIISKRPYKM